MLKNKWIRKLEFVAAVDFFFLCNINFDYWYYRTLSMITSGQVADISVRLSPAYLYLNSGKGLRMYSSTDLYGSPLPRWSCIPASSGRPACDSTSYIH